MIELSRYHRLKPRGLASAVVREDGSLEVVFKRFSVEDATEMEPERSIITFEDLEKRLAEIDTEKQVIIEFLNLRPRG